MYVKVLNVNAPIYHSETSQAMHVSTVGFTIELKKTEWVTESSRNIHLQRPKCCSTPVLLP